MFDNIGKKIKTATIVFFVVGAIVTFLVGLICYVDTEELIYIFIMLGGPFILWIESFFMYGFGELVDNSSKILQKLNSDNDKNEIKIQTNSINDVDVKVNNAKYTNTINVTSGGVQIVDDKIIIDNNIIDMINCESLDYTEDCVSFIYDNKKYKIHFLVGRNKGITAEKMFDIISYKIIDASDNELTNKDTSNVKECKY